MSKSSIITGLVFALWVGAAVASFSSPHFNSADVLMVVLTAFICIRLITPYERNQQ